MSKNIKIGEKVFTNVENISCNCADEDGVKRLFVDKDTTESSIKEEQEKVKTALNKAV